MPENQEGSNQVFTYANKDTSSLSSKMELESDMSQSKDHSDWRTVLQLYLPLRRMQQRSFSMFLMPKRILLIKWRLCEKLPHRYQTCQRCLLMLKWSFLGWIMCLCLSIRFYQSWKRLQKMLFKSFFCEVLWLLTWISVEF
jgi:hypothetical protein